MTGDFLCIDGELEIYFEEAGNGKQDILLIPGWTMSTRVFERQFEFFSASEQFRIISFDPRAHGRSSRGNRRHDYQQHARDLQAFIQARQLHDFILGGWSFGCLTALAYIRQYGSDALKGFIMIDGSPRVVGDDNRGQWVSYGRDDADGAMRFCSEARLQDPQASLRQFASWMLEDKSAENVAWVEAISEQTPAQIAVLLNQSALPLDFEADLAMLEGKIPLWFAMRDERRATVTNWAQQHTPSARVDAFGEHLMFWERAAEFNQALLEFALNCE